MKTKERIARSLDRRQREQREHERRTKCLKTALGNCQAEHGVRACGECETYRNGGHCWLADALLREGIRLSFSIIEVI